MAGAPGAGFRSQVLRSGRALLLELCRKVGRGGLFLEGLEGAAGDALLELVVLNLRTHHLDRAHFAGGSSPSLWRDQLFAADAPASPGGI